MPLPPNPEAARFADQLERSFRGGAWHGPALLEALDEIGADDAARRPLAGAHSVGEIVGHVTFWIDAARRRIGGEPVEDVPAKLDWPPDPASTESAWRAAVERLESAHRGLREAVLALDDAALDRPVAGSDPTLRGMLLGVLQHTAYHAGQIRILARATQGVAR